MNKLFLKAIISIFAIFSFVIISQLFFVSKNFHISSYLGTAVVDEEEISEEKGGDVVTFMAVGDVMLAREVEQRMINHKDWSYPFREVYELTSGADILFGNLETTILEGEVVQDGSFFFRTDPSAVEGLRLAGFDVLSLANNHIMNFGKSGLVSTMQNLDGVGIKYAGAGISEEQIFSPAIKEVKGIKFGFLAYSYSGELYSSYDDSMYGVADMDVERMEGQVSALKEKVDIVVVSMHAGIEYEDTSSYSQKEFARGAIDAGADIVIGHHPHVVQESEKYKEGYIIYSLGNFVFDQMWSEETRLGAITEITFENKKIVDVKFIPVKIFDYCQPRVIEGEEGDKILDKIMFK